jgi:hypothetical protein
VSVIILATPAPPGKEEHHVTASPATLVAPDTSSDVDFDLDVKLEPTDRHLSDDRPMRATECSCVECDTSAATCTGCP